MNKILAIIIAIALTGTILYATGIFDRQWEEPITPTSTDIMGGIWKQTATIGYADGTEETYSGDNILGTIFINDAEISWITAGLSVKPENLLSYDHKTVEMRFGEPDDDSMLRTAINCVGGDAYDNGERVIVSESVSTLHVQGTPVGESNDILNAGWIAYDIDGNFHNVGVMHFSAAYLDIVSGYNVLGYTGDFEIVLSYSGTDYIDYRIPSAPNDIYHLDAPTSIFTIGYKTYGTGATGGLTFDFDTTGGSNDPTVDPDDFVLKVEGRVRANPQLFAETNFDALIDNAYLMEKVSWLDGLNDWWNTLAFWTEDMKVVMTVKVSTSSGTYVGTQTKTQLIDPIYTPTTVGYGDFTFTFTAISGGGIHIGDTIELDTAIFEYSDGAWRTVSMQTNTITAVAR